MDAFIKMLDIQAVLMIFVVCGVICRKKNIINSNNQKQFIDFVLTILLPCMIFNSFKEITLHGLVESLSSIIICIFICFFAAILGKVLYKNTPDDKNRILRYATIINNASFAGLPLAEEAFGSEGLIFAAMFLMPLRIYMWVSGITILSNAKTSKKEAYIKVMKNPCVIAVFLGIARGLFQIELPSFTETAIQKIAACASPFSMIVVGAMIATVNIKTVMEKDVLVYTAVRLLLLPLGVLFITMALGLSKTAVGVSTILTAMPSSTTSVLLTAQYNGNVEFASKMMFVSTIFSLITVPVLMFFL